MRDTCRPALTMMTKQTNEIKKKKAQQQDEALIREAPPELHLFTVNIP